MSTGLTVSQHFNQPSYTSDKSNKTQPMGYKAISRSYVHIFTRTAFISLHSAQHNHRSFAQQHKAQISTRSSREISLPTKPTQHMHHYTRGKPTKFLPTYHFQQNFLYQGNPISADLYITQCPLILTEHGTHLPLSLQPNNANFHFRHRRHALFSFLLKSFTVYFRLAQTSTVMDCDPAHSIPATQHTAA